MFGAFQGQDGVVCVEFSLFDTGQALASRWVGVLDVGLAVVGDAHNQGPVAVMDSAVVVADGTVDIVGGVRFIEHGSVLPICGFSDVEEYVAVMLTVERGYVEALLALEAGHGSWPGGIAPPDVAMVTA